jgi:hypothetical protein
MDKLRVIYSPRPDATVGSELNALAAVHRFLLDRHGDRDAADRHLQTRIGKEVPDETLRK